MGEIDDYPNLSALSTSKVVMKTMAVTTPIIRSVSVTSHPTPRPNNLNAIRHQGLNGWDLAVLAIGIYIAGQLITAGRRITVSCCRRSTGSKPRAS